ncbi:spore coat protein U [Burkholderia sp. AU31652]|uniref:Spore coat protein U n=1 Tax=Burkholderia contaminans TaxID=488447 RepID=A0A6P3BXK9_9BURK|nr:MULTISPECIES: spore coat U domain-containing protein [Burkholderia]MDN7492907.1 spore coat U domain-containing protein [Burkholderia sp. AU45274]OXI86677.1 spore coat protein U [Burkholderia sp. AU31652]OXJ12295.1 spore coat protein U [Burkholderia sp. HI2500]VWD64371.1 spore coat protein U [Burkholderia contaminans]
MNATRRRVLSTALATAFAFAPALQPVTVAATYSNGNATAQFNVTLTIQANCTIAANPLAFGTTGVLASTISQQTTLSVTCTNSTPYNVGLDAGAVTGSTVASRLMAGTASGNTSTTVGYQIYQDSSHATVWGNTQGTDTVGGTGTGSAQTLNVYGQVPAQATPKPDTYQASVTATVYF